MSRPGHGRLNNCFHPQIDIGSIERHLGYNLVCAHVRMSNICMLNFQEFFFELAFYEMVTFVIYVSYYYCNNANESNYTLKVC
jgi:hypothetical protein